MAPEGLVFPPDFVVRTAYGSSAAYCVRTAYPVRVHEAAYLVPERRIGREYRPTATLPPVPPFTFPRPLVPPYAALGTLYSLRSTYAVRSAGAARSTKSP